VAKKIQNEEEGEQQKKTIYLEVGKKTQPKKTALSSRPVYGTIRTAVAIAPMFVDVAVLMATGQIVASGPSRESLNATHLEHAYGLALSLAGGRRVECQMPSAK
jgi:hypothetical protein